GMVSLPPLSSPAARHRAMPGQVRPQRVPPPARRAGTPHLAHPSTGRRRSHLPRGRASPAALVSNSPGRRLAGGHPGHPARAGPQLDRLLARDARVSTASFTLSEYLPGRDFAAQGLWRDGELLLLKVCERLSYFGGGSQPSGTSSTPALGKLQI